MILTLQGMIVFTIACIIAGIFLAWLDGRHSP